MIKEFCKCGHSKRTHVDDYKNTRCCACWQNKKDLLALSYIRMCECMSYIEVKEA